MNYVETQQHWSIMAARHGTRHRYVDGCRCEDCKASNRTHERDRRQRHASGEFPHRGAVVSLPAQPCGPGPVESGVEAEIEGLAEARPGLAQTALSLARVMDDPKAINQKAAAAKVLAALLDKLRSGAQGHRGRLAVVRTMSEKAVPNG
jgi:hypothetical protein